MISEEENIHMNLNSICGALLRVYGAYYQNFVELKGHLRSQKLTLIMLETVSPETLILRDVIFGMWMTHDIEHMISNIFAGGEVVKNLDNCL